MSCHIKYPFCRKDLFMIYFCIENFFLLYYRSNNDFPIRGNDAAIPGIDPFDVFVVKRLEFKTVRDIFFMKGRATSDHKHATLLCNMLQGRYPHTSMIPRWCNVNLSPP